MLRAGAPVRLPLEAPTMPRVPVVAQRGSRLARVVAWSVRAESLPARRLERRDWIYLASAFLLSRALIFALGVLGAAMFPMVAPGKTWLFSPPTGFTPDLWMRIYVHFDSGWYLGISHSYLTAARSSPGWLNEWAFFPFYPMVLHVVSIGLNLLRIPGNTDALAGILVSHAALLGALVYLYRLVSAEVNTEAARRAVTYLVIFPASLFLSAVYPEGLFTLLTVGAFYHARRRQWFLAGALAALATVTRVQGICILLPLALEYASALRARRFTHGTHFLSGAWLGLPFVGLGCYALYSHAQTGYWLAFIPAGKLWGRTLTPALYPLVRYLIAPSLGGAFSFDFTSANFVTAVGFLLLAIVAARRLPPSYALWLAVGLLVPLSSGGHQMTSLMRYASTLFPAFVVMAMWSLGIRWTPNGILHDVGHAPSTSDLRDRIITMPSLMLLSLMVVMYTNGVWAAV